nr:uncharacterized protein LOC111834465 [Paramormyrops kingsleyae]
MWGHVTGVWEDDPEDRVLADQLEERMARTEVALKRETSLLEDRVRPLGSDDEGDSEGACHDKVSRPPRHQFPLLRGAGGQWMDKLDQLTQGTKLALRDFRAVAARCLTKHSLLEVEDRAGTLTHSDDVSLTTIVLHIGNAMREMFPPPTRAVIPKLTWDKTMHPREYLDKCTEEWTRRTGSHPGQQGVQREWFRRAVMEGVPEGVRAAILGNPDLPGADSHVWDRHVIHHLKRAKDESWKEESDLKELQTQLLKLQVGEARQKANENKKRVQTGKLMVAEATAGGPPPQPMPGEDRDRGEADPMLYLVVMDKELPFLVDTGATYSTLNMVPKDSQVSTSTVTVVGFSGVEQKLPESKPVNLLGRDVLVKLGASILCSADGLVVTLPKGTQLRDSTEWYEELFSEQLEGHKWQVSSQNIYVGPEVVASATILTPEQQPWYRMGQEGVPHISIALHPKYQAKDLDPMVKKAQEAEDWVETQIPAITFSPTGNTGCQWRYTRLPQGFALSPGIFNQVLKQALEGRPLADGVTLVQYVDDLLIAAPSPESALEATRAVLCRLAEKGFKAADLALPDYSLPFHLDVSETETVANGVLFQKKGGERKVLMYVSVGLDMTEKHHPACTRHAAGVERIIQKTAHIVMGLELHILTSHSVVAYVNSQTFTMTSLRQQRLSKILEAPHLTFVHEGINMADRMGTGEPHECEYRVLREEKVRPNPEAENIERTEDWFTDGCCFRHETRGLQAGYAVVVRQGDDFVTLKAERLEGPQSAQQAEVVAVIEALKLGKGKDVTIYSDSAYAVGAVNVELSQWLRAGFLTAGNKPIKHEAEMRELAEALQLPRTVAVVKCKGHEGSGTKVARGNQAADEEAKRLAGYQTVRQLVSVEEEIKQEQELTRERVGQEQEKASPVEKAV